MFVGCRSHFWGGMAALCELTNVFLTIEECLLCAPETARRHDKSLAVKCVQWGFKASYVLLRLILFPVMLFWMWHDLRGMASADYHRLGAFELVVFPSSILFVFGLSVRWALMIDADEPPGSPRGDKRE